MNILIADDHPLVRRGIQGTLSSVAEWNVVGEAHDTDETLQLLAQKKPDVLILDLEMPGSVAADELAEKALQMNPALRILVVTAHNDEKTLRRLSKVKIGGYLLKDEAPQSLLQAVRTVAGGATWFSQPVIQKLMQLSTQPDLAPNLTPREKMILILIGQGKENKVIAEELALAEQTVRNYASTIYEKLGLNSRVEAVVWARENGLVQ